MKVRKMTKNLIRRATVNLRPVTVTVDPKVLSAPTKTDNGWVITNKSTGSVWRKFPTRDAARDAKRSLAA